MNLLSERPWIGGSSISAILGLPNPGNRTPLTEYLRLLGKAPDLDAEDEEFFEGRKSLESFMAHKLKYKAKVVPTAMNVRYCDAEHSWLRAEIDAETNEENDEFKTSSEFVAPRQFGDEGTEDYPIYMAAQCQWGLGIRPKPVGYLNVCIGFDRWKRFRIEPDADLFQEMRSKAINFVNNYVIPGIQPPPINIDDLKLLYPRSTAQSILADKVLMGHLERMAEADARLKAAKAEKEDCHFEVAMMLGEADTAINEHGKVVVTYKTQQRKACSVEASEARVMLNKLKA